MDAYFPFVRLGVVRFQPDSLQPDSCNPDPTQEARISPVVMADFVQIAPNRWIHLQRRDVEISISISGVNLHRR